nr:DNA-binding domain-containing protein [uncultured Pseudoxanthomonas sp.]
MSAAASLHGAFATALRHAEIALPASVADERAARRLAIHRNTFVVSLVDSLAASFPVTHALVGETFFRAMARERVLADPPRSPVLTDYALDFPDFIAAFAPAAAVAGLADVARIEALRIRAYHATDAVPLADTAYHALLQAPTRLPGTRVMLHPACAWFRASHAALSVWQAHQGLTDLADAHLDGIDTRVSDDVLIARPVFDVRVAALPAGALAWLDALAAGRTLGEAFALAHAAAAHTDDGALFALLLAHGLAIAFDLPPES